MARQDAVEGAEICPRATKIYEADTSNPQGEKARPIPIPRRRPEPQTFFKWSNEKFEVSPRPHPTRPNHADHNPPGYHLVGHTLADINRLNEELELAQNDALAPPFQTPETEDLSAKDDGLIRSPPMPAGNITLERIRDYNNKLIEIASHHPDEALDHDLRRLRRDSVSACNEERASIIEQYQQEKVKLDRVDEIVAARLDEFNRDREAQLQKHIDQLSFDLDAQKLQHAFYLSPLAIVRKLSSYSAAAAASDQRQALVSRHRRDTAKKRRQLIQNATTNYEYKTKMALEDFEKKLLNHHHKFEGLYSDEIPRERAVAAWVDFADQTCPGSEAALYLKVLRSDFVDVIEIEDVRIRTRENRDPVIP